MKKVSYLPAVIFLAFVLSAFSLKAQNDTTKILDQLKIINELLQSNTDTCRSLIFTNLSQSKKVKYNRGIVRNLLALTQYYSFKGYRDSSYAIIPELERESAKSKDVKLRVNAKLKVAVIFSDFGNFAQATKKALEAQVIADSVSDHKLLSKIYHDLGFIYNNKQLLPSALKYFKHSLEEAYLAKDSFAIANTSARIGGVFNDMKIGDSGFVYNSKSLYYFEKIGMKRGIGIAYNNLAGSCELLKDYKKSLEFYNKALVLRKEMGDEYAITILKFNMGTSYYELKDYAKAKNYFLEVLERARIETNYDMLMNTYKQLTVIARETNDPVAYMKYAGSYIYFKDSITGAENLKAISELQNKYESEKKEKDILLLKKENEKKDELNRVEKKNKLIVIVASVFIVLLMAVFARIVWKRYKITMRQKSIIEKQKQQAEHQKILIEEKQKEVMDSITYAKRLQDAILPSSSHWKNYVPNGFVLYKPKDIVAGDFYWLEVVKEIDKNGDENELILLAAADCTGHGVPGAMVSVVCSNALNRAVKEFKLKDPALILNKVRELVIETFERSESEVKDGMDISLCVINKKEMLLKWAGANNPLWIIKHNTNELIEYTADKMPIGKYAEEKSFTTHVINLDFGDKLYLFTDGFADQFGGPKGKKFKYKQFHDLVLSINSLDFVSQKTELNKSIEAWRGELEQVDDICVIGVGV